MLLLTRQEGFKRQNKNKVQYDSVLGIQREYKICVQMKNEKLKPL